MSPRASPPSRPWWGIELYNEPIPTETAELDVLHDEVIAAVHQADPGRLAFFEPNALRNLQDYANIAARPPWPGTVYAPHVYTLAFSGSDADKQAMTRDTLAPSNESARREADSWDAPLAITEFGYDPAGIKADDYLVWQTELQDASQASSFYWVWKEESQGSWGIFDHDAATDAWTVRDHVRKSLARVAVEGRPRVADAVRLRPGQPALRARLHRRSGDHHPGADLRARRGRLRGDVHGDLRRRGRDGEPRRGERRGGGPLRGTGDAHGGGAGEMTRREGLTAVSPRCWLGG